MPLKIGIVTTGFPRFESDIAGQFVLEFAQALIARRHQVQILCPSSADLKSSFDHVPGASVMPLRYMFPKSLERTFYNAGAPDNLQGSPVAWAGGLSFSGRLAFELWKRRAQYDAVFAHWTIPCGVAAMVARVKKLCVIAHGSDIHMLSRLPGRHVIAHQLVLHAHALVFVSRELKERFGALLGSHDQALFKSKCHVMSMGVSDALGESVTSKPVSTNSNYKVLYLGRLHPNKGVSDAIQAIRHCHNTELWIAGQGSERQALMEQAKDLKDRVRFLGSITGTAKRDLFVAADICVFPSRHNGQFAEGSPVALLEAMAAGKPVIATVVGGMAEHVIHDKSGILVPSNNPLAIANAIAELQHNPEKIAFLSKNAKKMGRQHVWSQRIVEFESLIRCHSQDAVSHHG